MNCYLCKMQTKSSVRFFLKAKTRREKDGFRDICDQCYKLTMTKAGYILIENIWTKEKQ